MWGVSSDDEEYVFSAAKVLRTPDEHWIDEFVSRDRSVSTKTHRGAARLLLLRMLTMSGARTHTGLIRLRVADDPNSDAFKMYLNMTFEVCLLESNDGELGMWLANGTFHAPGSGALRTSVLAQSP